MRSLEDDGTVGATGEILHVPVVGLVEADESLSRPLLPLSMKFSVLLPAEDESATEPRVESASARVGPDFSCLSNLLSF